MNLQNAAASSLAAWLLLYGSSAQADPDTLSSLIAGADEQTRLAAPLRADITAQIDGVQGKRQDRIVVIYRGQAGRGSGVQTYLEFEKEKFKALLLGGGESYVSAAGKVKKAALDTSIDSTSWILEDLLPFSSSRCASIRIADLTPEQMTITCEPKKDSASAYSLVVYKFERSRFVPLQVLYYKDTLNNLVKMARHDDFEQVGSKWRPKTVVMQDFKLHAKDSFEIKWSQDPKFPPELFDPRSLAAAAAPRGFAEKAP